jgi:hypothetical protein
VRSEDDGGQAKVVNGPLKGQYVNQKSTVKWVLGLDLSVFRVSNKPQAIIFQPPIFIHISTLKTVATRSSEKSNVPQFHKVPRQTPTHRENIKPLIQ